jgi:polar amino acid transport system substrate-binding protein
MPRNRAPFLLALPLLLAAVACAPEEDSTTAPSDEETSASEETSPTTPTTPAEGESGDACAPEALPLKTKGQLTIGTDSPAYEPWFQNDDPTNGKGFESAVAYAVADELGFGKDAVTWVKVPFNTSYAPGEKKFDFDINQISITPQRAQVVDFSDGYYSAAQAVLAPKKSPAAESSTLADLAKLKLGAQTGTTSLSAITDVIKPEQQPLVFDDTNAAKQALLNGQVDAILADLPTAFYIAAVEIPEATIVGQFQPAAGDTEEFGMLFEKGSELVPCVNDALGALRESGELEQIESRWLSEVVDVPVLE